MEKLPDKRTVDMRIISEWIESDSSVLDLGCGRGVLLEYLIQTKSVFGVGVDWNMEKVSSCIKRGVPAYQGDLIELMKSFPDKFFDRVVCSRTVQELNNPAQVLLEALRLADSVTVGFVNYGYWKNRFHHLVSGSHIINEVNLYEWYEGPPTHPISISEFEWFCNRHHIEVTRRVYLRGDWETPCEYLPNLLCGYALFELTQ